MGSTDKCQWRFARSLLHILTNNDLAAARRAFFLAIWSVPHKATTPTRKGTYLCPENTLAVDMDVSIEARARTPPLNILSVCIPP